MTIDPSGYVGSVRYIVVLAAPALALVAACGTPHRDDVAAAAQRFVRAVNAHDGAAACALLTPQAANSAAGATDQSCAQAVLNVDESGTAIHGVQVWRDAAQVHIGSDTLFLRRLPGGWRIAAAGCTP